MTEIDEKLTLSMPNELPLMARSCSSRLLFRSRSCIRYVSVQTSSNIDDDDIDDANDDDDDD